MSTEHILKDISSVRRFVDGRKALSGAVDPGMLSNFASSLIRMINTATVFGKMEAASIQDALADSPYGEDGTARLLKAIDARVAAASAASDAKPGPAKKPQGQGTEPKQFLKTWWHYFTAEDWLVFNDPKKSFNSKMTQAVERANSVGCINCHEQSFKWLLAFLLLVHYDELPTYRQIFDKLHDLKACALAERKPYAHEMLVEFPEDPSELPRSVWNFAYSASPPTKVTMQGVNTVSEHIPLRGNSKLLKGKKLTPGLDSADLAHVKTEHSSEAASRPVQASPAPMLAKQEHTDLEALVGADIATPAEQALLAEFQRKLQLLRAAGQPAVATSPEASHAAASPPVGTIALRRGPDGVMQLTRPIRRSDAACAVKEEGDPPKVDTDVPDIKVDDLDPYSRAAVEALTKRKADKEAKKAAEKAAKKEATAKAKATAKATCKTAAKAEGGVESAPEPKKRGRPCKKEHGSDTAATKRKKPPAAAAGVPMKKAKSVKKPKAEIIEVPKTEILKRMPKLPADGSNPPPVHYNGGVIYTSRSVKRFRALRARGDKYSEQGAAWSAPSTMASAWKTVVHGIDSYKRGKV